MKIEIIPQPTEEVREYGNRVYISNSLKWHVVIDGSFHTTCMTLREAKAGFPGVTFKRTDQGHYWGRDHVTSADVDAAEEAWIAHNRGR